MLRLACVFLTVSALSGCATHYMDSADSNHGGRFVVGAYNNQATVFHCPDGANQGDCKRIKVNYK